MASLTLKKNTDSHYENYLRYADKLRAENARIFTASQQHTIPAYSPFAMYPKVEAK